MLYSAVIIIFFTTFLFIYLLLISLNRGKIKIESRIGQIVDMNLEENQDSEAINFSERAIKPFYEYFNRLILKTTPKNQIEALNKNLERAGLLKNSTTERWMYTKIMITSILSILFALLSYLLEPNILKSISFALLTILSINVIFRFYISSKVTNRKRLILKDLPFTLDLITVSVEAGLSFDGAMVRVLNNINGELCDEFAKSLKEIRMGIQRKTALRNMSERCEVKELSILITSLIQADEMGISLGKVLRIEASNLREHRKQVAREKAMKAPIKMLFPLIFFIFPSIFIIILGPAIIKILNIFAR
ncbi:MAG: type II secretion system F family protein [Clostridiaceae bacterium]|nr:type II secretion system F family protein [Clostridiaceae bacterium]